MSREQPRHLGDVARLEMAFQQRMNDERALILQQMGDGLTSEQYLREVARLSGLEEARKIFEETLSAIQKDW